MRTLQKRRGWAMAASIAVGLLVHVALLSSALAGLDTLKGEPVPLPPNLDDFVADRAAAIRLGKAFFWDMNTGSDGIQACASCHFNAGEDIRNRNSINPGPNGIFDTVGPDGRLLPPFFPILSDDIKGAQGVVLANFVGLSGTPVDSCQSVPDPVFNVNGSNRRQVTGRKAPTTINAVFNYRSFWDGRANNIFNGVTPLGPAGTETPTVLQVINGTATPVVVSIPNASLASQAVGPPNNPVEMSCNGRTFPQLGRKLLGLPPLSQQLVDPTDSVLGGVSLSPANGISTNYREMIQAAFHPRWWDSADIVNGFTVMENNFSLYWGLSILLYEATLVSDDSRFDRYMAGDQTQMTPQEIRGMRLFGGKARCTHCHDNAELTLATIRRNKPLEGFFNLGVRPLAEDGGDILQPGQGKFKTPGLRNVELRGPFFHQGAEMNLRQAVEFYDNGGRFPDEFTDGNIRPLDLTPGQINTIVLFLLSLTDDRVKFERAPFDHPSIFIPRLGTLPAVGAAGRATPLGTFLGVSQTRLR